MWPLLKSFMGPYGTIMGGEKLNDMGSSSDLPALVAAFKAAHAKNQAASVGSLGPQPAAPTQTAQAAAPAPASSPWMAPPMAPAVPLGPSAVPMPQPRPVSAPTATPQAPAAAQAVPMPMARPASADASLSQPQPDTGFFMRNALMMKDPSTGSYIDPTGAASVRGPDLITKMIALLHDKATG